MSPRPSKGAGMRFGPICRGLLFAILVSASLTGELTSEVMKMRGNWTEADSSRAIAVIGEAGKFEVDLDTDNICNLVQEDLLALAHRLMGDPSPEVFETLIKIMRISEALGLSVRKDLVENIIIELNDNVIMPAIARLKDPQGDLDEYYRIMDMVCYTELLNFSPRKIQNALVGFETQLRERGIPTGNRNGD